MEKKTFVRVPTYKDGREVRVGDEVVYRPLPDATFVVQSIMLTSNPSCQWMVTLLAPRDGRRVERFTSGTVLTCARLGEKRGVKEILADFGEEWVRATSAETESKLLDAYAEIVSEAVSPGGGRK